MKKDTIQLINVFFRQSDDETALFYSRNAKCKPPAGRSAKAYKQRPGSAWTNIQTHFGSCVGHNFEKVYRDHVTKSGSSNEGQVYGSPCDADVFQVIKWVVMPKPVLEVSNPITRDILKMKPVFFKSVRKYILSMVPSVELSISAELLEKFRLLFDYCSHGFMHYVAILQLIVHAMNIKIQSLPFHLFWKNKTWVLRSAWSLSMGYYRFMTRAYKMALNLSDNCSVNQHLSSFAKVSLTGCTAHKFNLAVEEMCDEFHGS